MKIVPEVAAPRRRRRAKRRAAPAARPELRACTICGETFMAWPAPKGRRRRTCGDRCHAESIARLIGALEVQLEKLLEGRE